MPDYSFALRAFRARNYRLFFAGQSVSLIGTWMTRIASSWLMYRLTGSALLLGLAGFVGQIPCSSLAPSSESGSTAGIATACSSSPRPPA